MQRAPRRRGFTLIELMVVLMLFLLLVSLIAPQMVRARYRAQLTACMDQVKSLATALEQYSVDHKVYPLALDATFCRAYLNRDDVLCPMGLTPYTLQVDNVEHSFTLNCGGSLHHVALPGYVNAGYPQFSHLTGSVVLK